MTQNGQVDNTYLPTYLSIYLPAPVLYSFNTLDAMEKHH